MADVHLVHDIPRRPARPHGRVSGARPDQRPMLERGGLVKYSVCDHLPGLL
jgi:hypothetical protein